MATPLSLLFVYIFSNLFCLHKAVIANLPNSAFSASSQLSGREAYRAKMNDVGWSTASIGCTSVCVWLQIDLQNAYTIHSITTKGSGGSEQEWWVTYTIQYGKTTNVRWSPYTFSANSDKNTAVTNYPGNIIARYLIIYMKDYSGWPTLRVEIDGTRYFAPTQNPSTLPTLSPTYIPTKAPTNMPTNIPTSVPTMLPTLNPTYSPTKSPTLYPTKTPTLLPTNVPSVSTTNPTVAPKDIPSIPPTSNDAPVLFSNAPTPVTTNDAQALATENDATASYVVLIIVLLIVTCVICLSILIIITLYKMREKKLANAVNKINGIQSTHAVVAAEPGGFSLEAWLSDLKLKDHYNMFVMNGFGDRCEQIYAITNEELKEMGVKVGHRKLILTQIQKDKEQLKKKQRQKRSTISKHGELMHENEGIQVNEVITNGAGDGDIEDSDSDTQNYANTTIGWINTHGVDTTGGFATSNYYATNMNSPDNNYKLNVYKTTLSNSDMMYPKQSNSDI